MEPKLIRAMFFHFSGDQTPTWGEQTWRVSKEPPPHHPSSPALPYSFIPLKTGSPFRVKCARACVPVIKGLAEPKRQKTNTGHKGGINLVRLRLTEDWKTECWCQNLAERGLSLTARHPRKRGFMYGPSLLVVGFIITTGGPRRSFRWCCSSPFFFTSTAPQGSGCSLISWPRRDTPARSLSEKII